MSWLLNLYPPAWQRRFRDEVQAHLDEAGPMGIRTALDLIAGAIDAQLNQDWIPNPTPGGEHDMITASRCRTADVSIADALRSAGWMIGVCLVLTVIATTLDKLLGDHILIEALLYSAFFIAFTVSSRNTYLRPYSRTARNVIIGVSTIGWYVFFLAVALIGEMT